MSRGVVSTIIEVDWLPLFDDVAIEDLLLVMRIEIAVHVPATTDVSIECVCFALSRAAAFGAVRFEPVGRPCQGAAAVTGRLKVIQLRQNNRQLVFWHQHRAVFGAIYNRDRCTQ